MGSGIAQKCAQEGMLVVMVDMEDSFVNKGMENIRTTLAEAVERKIFKQEQTEEILGRIIGTTSLENVADADLVIEVVFEDMDVKKDLFKRLDEMCDPKTVLASNTSSFSITELASAVVRKDRYLGLHFFYHPAKNRLLEVIPGKETSPETIALGNTFARLIGKTGINVADAPGFAVNRFFVPWLNEATRLHEEGISIPAIDTTAKKVFKIGMGPFVLMNATGVPIAYHSTVSLGNELGDFYGPSDRLKEQFEKGEEWDLSGDVDVSHAPIIEERLLGAVFVVACKLVEEGVANIEDTDRGAKIGLRWSRGPFEMMNRLGIERSYEIVTKFADIYPDIQVPTNLKTQHEQNQPWPISFIDLAIEGNVARILFNRPEVMNALNEEVMRQLDDRFEKANANPGVKAIVLQGAGKTFIAGAEIGWFIKKIEANRILDIVESTTYWHDIVGKFQASDKLVIAVLDGVALGGGVEVALACDTIIATERGSISFPETGIGIYPGLGGTQRTTRYIGKELAKYLIFTGKSLDARTATSIGLVEYVVTPEEVEAKIAELVKSEDIITKSAPRSADLPEQIENIKGLFSDENLQSLLKGEGDLDEFGQKLAKTISYKAPNAIRIANKLIDEGGPLDLKDGLQMELDHLIEIFSTKDALEGLKSVIERRRPTFTGK
jgi:enoyl-CoA hydratase/3-hydroxyacyl-CoA dehydrogenase